MTTPQPTIDILEVIGSATTLKRAGTINGRGPELAGACPFCGGTDRFRVQPEQGQWWCRQCSPNEHWQNAADYVMRRDGVDFKAAMKALGQWQEPDTWDYHDAAGNVIYQVVRFEKNGEKHYYQRLPDGRKGLHGVERTIYHLPDVLRAAAAGEAIYVVEGEKCADVLRRLGLTATTNSGGAGKWRPEFSRHLRGAATVYVLADNDEPGRKHAMDVWRATVDIVDDTRVIEFSDLPTAGDVADWLALGKTKSDLVARCSAPPASRVDVTTGEIIDSTAELVTARAAIDVTGSAQHPTPITAAELGVKELPPTRYFIPEMLRAGLALFVGNPGIGKTPALIQLALAFATGGRWLGALPCPKCRVLYIGVEYDEAYIKETMIDSYGSTDLPPELFILSLETFTPPATEEESIAMLSHYLDVMEIDVVIIDVFSGFLPREKFKMDKYRGDYAEFLAYQRMFLNKRALLVGAWHGGKHAKDPETAYNGGQGMWGSAGGGRLTMMFDEEQQVRLRSQLRGHERREWVLEQARIGNARFWSVVDADPDPIFGSDAQRRIYMAIKRFSSPAEPLTPAGVRGILQQETSADVVPLKEPYIRQTLSRLEDRGILRKCGGGYIINKSNGSRGSDGSLGSRGSGGSQSSRAEGSDPKDPSRSNGAIQHFSLSDAEIAGRSNRSTDPQDDDDAEVF